MIVTSLSALAVSVRSTLNGGTSKAGTTSSAAARKKSAIPGTDTVELSKDRAETLIKALDTDGDGIVTKEELTDGALELLKRGAVRFHHLPQVPKDQGPDKRDDRWTSRLEDVFAHVDRNHDGAIDATELTSALPKPVAAATSVTAVEVAIKRYITGA